MILKCIFLFAITMHVIAQHANILKTLAEMDRQIEILEKIETINPPTESRSSNSISNTFKLSEMPPEKPLPENFGFNYTEMIFGNNSALKKEYIEKFDRLTSNPIAQSSIYDWVTPSTILSSFKNLIPCTLHVHSPGFEREVQKKLKFVNSRTNDILTYDDLVNGSPEAKKYINSFDYDYNWVLLAGGFREKSCDLTDMMKDRIPRNFNIICIDWDAVNSDDFVNYPQVSQMVAQYMHKPIETLFTRPIIDSNNMEKVKNHKIYGMGFSLGAQILTFFGRQLASSNIFRMHTLFALDPAGPCFERNSYHYGLKLNDPAADNIQTIHTDLYHMGYQTNTGHLNIWINGGPEVQPKCNPNENPIEFSQCNHHMAKRIAPQFIEELYYIGGTYNQFHVDDRFILERGKLLFNSEKFRNSPSVAWIDFEKEPTYTPKHFEYKTCDSNRTDIWCPNGDHIFINSGYSPVFVMKGFDRNLEKYINSIDDAYERLIIPTGKDFCIIFRTNNWANCPTLSGRKLKYNYSCDSFVASDMMFIAFYSGNYRFKAETTTIPSPGLWYTVETELDTIVYSLNDGYFTKKLDYPQKSVSLFNGNSMEFQIFGASSLI